MYTKQLQSLHKIQFLTHHNNYEGQSEELVGSLFRVLCFVFKDNTV